jgi:hypothetical protein
MPGKNLGLGKEKLQFIRSQLAEVEKLLGRLDPSDKDIAALALRLTNELGKVVLSLYEANVAMAEWVDDLHKAVGALAFVDARGKEVGDTEH